MKVFCKHCRFRTLEWMCRGYEMLSECTANGKDNWYEQGLQRERCCFKNADNDCPDFEPRKSFVTNIIDYIEKIVDWKTK